MPEKRLIRVDLHSHTHYSPDSANSPRDLVRRARAAGLDKLAVTDHGVIAGALEALSIDPDLIIPGEEIKCRCGTHIIGLYISSLIPNGKSVPETAQRIRDQGGVVYAPHPFAYLRSPSARAARAIAVADVVEVFNARAFIGAWNRRAAAAAEAKRLPGVVGSDAHFGLEVGKVYTEMPAFTDARSLLAAVKHARPGRLATATPLVHAGSITIEVMRTLLRRRNGRGTAPPR